MARTKNRPETRHINLNLDMRIYKMLEEYCLKNGMTKTHAIERALDAFLTYKQNADFYIGDLEDAEYVIDNLDEFKNWESLVQYAKKKRDASHYFKKLESGSSNSAMDQIVQANRERMQILFEKMNKVQNNEAEETEINADEGPIVSDEDIQTFLEQKRSNPEKLTIEVDLSQLEKMLEAFGLTIK